MEFTVGEGKIIKGFENAVREMKVNEEKTVKIKPSEAYGERNEQMVFPILRDRFPPDLKIDVGGKMILKSPEGKQIPATVSSVDSQKIMIDLNHPLAGKELTFKLKLIAVNYRK